jgi:hypothetical protein
MLSRGVRRARAVSSEQEAPPAAATGDATPAPTAAPLLAPAARPAPPLNINAAKYLPADQAIPAAASAAPSESGEHRLTIAELLTRQVDEVCACDSQACVDQAVSDYASVFGSAVPSADDAKAIREAALRVATCQREQEVKWGLPSTDNHPLSLNDTAQQPAQ